MKFKTEKINYQERFKKNFLFAFLFYFSIVLYSLLQSHLTIEFSISVILLIGIGLVLSIHLKSRKYFYEVEITEKSVFLKGDYINKPLLIDLPITKTDIIIKSSGRPVQYFIRFRNESKNYDINQFYNWNHDTLIQLFHSFKEAKKEKIIWDEKYLLEFMEKKAKQAKSKH